MKLSLGFKVTYSLHSLKCALSFVERRQTVRVFFAIAVKVSLLSHGSCSADGEANSVFFMYSFCHLCFVL